MRWVRITLFLLMCLISSLQAVPRVLQILPSEPIRSKVGEITSFCIDDQHLYLTDAKKNEVIVLDLQTGDLLPYPESQWKNLGDPTDIFADKENIYICEAKENRISIYDKKGMLIRVITNKNSDEYAIKAPQQVFVNDVGVLYIFDTDRKEIMSFSNEGFFLGSVGVTKPIAMTMDATQNIHVLQEGDDGFTIVVYDSNLNFQRKVEFSKEAGELFKGVGSFSINMFGEYYFISNDKCYCFKTDGRGQLITKSKFGTKAKNSSAGYFSDPTIIRAYYSNSKNEFLILDAKHNVVQIIEDDNISNTTKLKPSLLTRLSYLKTIPDFFIDEVIMDSLVTAIKEIPNSSGFLSSSEKELVSKSGISKLYNTQFKELKKKKMSVDNPRHILVTNEKIYISDDKANQIFMFNKKDGTVISSFGEKGSDEGNFKRPGGIVQAQDGSIYICDTDNNRISVYTDDGIFLRNLLNPILEKPIMLCITSKNELYVLLESARIVKISNLDNPEYVAINTRANKISWITLIYDDMLAYVNDEKQQIVIVKNNREILSFGGKGNVTDPMQFKSINAMAFDSYWNKLYVSDKEANNTKVFQFFLSPMTPTGFVLNITDQKEVLLQWDPLSPIRNYKLYIKTDQDSSFVQCSINHHLINYSTPNITSYKISSIGLDGRESVPSAPIKDVYSYAKYLEETGYYLQAIEMYKLILSQNEKLPLQSKIAELHEKYGALLEQDQHYEEAIEQYKIAASLRENNQDLVVRICTLYKLLKLYDTGLEYLFSHVIDQTYAEEIISFYYLSDDYDRVIENGELYQKDYPNDETILQLLAAAYEKKTQYIQSLEIYRKLAGKKNMNYIYKSAEMLVLLNRYDDAIAEYQKLLSLYINDPQPKTKFLLGKVYYLKKQYGLASDNILEAIQADTTQAEYYYTLGMVYVADRKLDESIKNMKKAYQLNPSDYVTAFDLAKIYEKKNMLKEALSALDNAYQYIPSDTSAVQYHVFYGDLLLRYARYDEAFREFNVAARLFPTNPMIISKQADAVAAREKYNHSRDPVEISKITFDPVFPSLLEYYRNHAVGFVNLFNTRNIPVRDVQVEVAVPDLITNNWTTTVVSILANEEVQQEITLPLDNKLISFGAERTFSATIKLSYTLDNVPYTKSIAQEIKVLNLNAMNWTNRRQLACFVNPMDTGLRNYINQYVIQPFSKKPARESVNKNITTAVEIYSYLSARGIHYISDPSSANDVSASEIDYVQFPSQTITIGGGDCDDLLTLLAASLSVNGIQTAFVDYTNHVNLVFDSGLKPDEIEKKGFSYSQFIVKNNVVWLPIETTLIGKETFESAWTYAAKRYYDTSEAGIVPGLISFNDSHQIYPAVGYQGTYPTDVATVYNSADTLFEKDMSTIETMSQHTVENEYKKQIEIYPDNQNVKNQFAMWYVKNDKLEQAQEIWNNILSLNTNNVTALINIANIYLLQQKYNEAKDYYLRALALSADNDGIYRNLCILELKQNNILKAKEYFSKIKDINGFRRTNPEVYKQLVE